MKLKGYSILLRRNIVTDINKNTKEILQAINRAKGKDYINTRQFRRHGISLSSLYKERIISV
jgi:hypothetical protein